MFEDNAPPPPDASPQSRAMRYALAALAVVVLLGVLGAAFLQTEAALKLAVTQIERASKGSLRIENASGTLLTTIRAQRLAWTGPTASLAARDVALDWSPRALWSGRVVIRGIGIGHLAYEAGSSNEPTTLPADLSLPIEVEIDRAAVGHLDWRVGERSGTVTGLSFAYRGGQREHRVTDFVLVFERGTLEASGTLGASAPFPVDAAVRLAGNETISNARAGATVKGTLREMTATIEGRVAEATGHGRVDLAPFSEPPLRSLEVDARAIDLAALHGAWPTTQLNVHVSAAPAGGGMSGTASIRNGAAGAWDANRLPIAGADARFALAASDLALSDLVATLPGGGRISGNGSLAFGRALDRSTWSLDVRDLDLSRIYSTLVATRLAGRLAAEVAQARQVVTADLAQQDMALAFQATVDGTRIEATRVRARAGAGRFAGRGAIHLDGKRPFEIDGTFEGLDPARFGQFPSGALSGSLAINGSLQPTWAAQGRLTVATGSRLSGVSLSGEARGQVSPARVRDATVDLLVGAGRARASGNAGAAGDQLAFTLDAIRLLEVAQLLPGRLPSSLDGTLRAKGSLALEPGSPGGIAEVQAEHLRYDDIALDHLRGHVELAPGGVATVPVENRHVELRLVARGVRLGARAFASVRVDGDGTLASHRAALQVEGEGLALSLRAHGSAREVREATGSSSIAWTGTLDALENAGRWPARLESPATIAYERGRIAVGAVALAVADGRVRIRDFVFDDGRISTRGEFDGIAVATASRLAGYTPPFATDLVLAGEWAIAATPRLNGTVAIRRQKGDVYVSETDLPAGSPFSFGITALLLEARLVDDEVDARIDFRSARAGNAQARAQIGVAPGAAPARLSSDAPLVATLAADLPTLRSVQPWLGTNAVIDGRARLNASARGRLADPALSFDLAGEALRIDAPQYGLHLRDGRLRARDEGGSIVLSELSIQGGDGRFTASGTVTSLRRDGAGIDANMRIAWKADRFRLLNRPDMRLVVDGSGTVGVEGRKLALRGAVKVVQGHFEYARTSDGLLSDDVVIVGREPPAATEARGAKAPLGLDLEVDLGNDLTFSGEGLETGLRGRVHVTTTGEGRLSGRGAIRAVNGTYFAFGQRLAIDRGRLVFDGPLDNPALDIVALRRNQPVEAGVAVKGSVKVPIVTLVSNPPVPDSEKLSWLVLGRSGDAQTGADAAALQAASAALFSRGGKPLTTQIAQKFGLDDISFGSAGSTSAASGSGAGMLSNQVVVFGKRISDRFSIAYQQGLTAASNALRLDYALSRTLTVRAEAGVNSSVGIYYRRTYD